MTRRLLTSLTAWLTAFAIAFAPAAGAGDAVAINTKDDSVLVRIVFDIKHVMGDTVDTQNAAAAVASCNSCETVAIAFQVVLAASDPSVVVPQNIAIAMNIDCNTCQTLAEAFQYVYTGTGNMHFTSDGNRRIAEMRKELRDLQKSGLPIDEIAARVEAINQELQQVLLTEIVSAGNSQPPGQPADGGGTDTTTTPSDTGTTTSPSDTGTGTSTTPTQTDTGTQTTPSDTGTTGTTGPQGDTGTQTTPSG